METSDVQVALRANHLGLSNFINNRVTAGQPEVTNAKASQMLRMAQKSNSMIPALTMRNAAFERDARRLVEIVTGLETNSEVQETARTIRSDFRGHKGYVQQAREQQTDQRVQSSPSIKELYRGKEQVQRLE